MKYQCCKCRNHYEITTDAVACCNCCDDGEFYDPIDQNKEKKIEIPYIVCPNCEAQLLNPIKEEGMLHFTCHECGSEVWYDYENEEE